MSEDEARTRQIVERMTRWSHHRWVPPPEPPRHASRIGSRWRLRAPAWFLEWPRSNTTLALSGHGKPDLAAGTRLRLAEVDYLSDVHELDMATWFQYHEGWETLSYVVEDGRWTGRRIVFAAGADLGRFPRSSVQAHAALEPIAEDDAA